MANAKRYRVTAPCVIVKTGQMAGFLPGRGGFTAVTIYRDGLIPEDAPEAQIRHFVDNGMVEAIAA